MVRSCWRRGSRPRNSVGTRLAGEKARKEDERKEKENGGRSATASRGRTSWGQLKPWRKDDEEVSQWGSEGQACRRQPSYVGSQGPKAD